MLDDAKPNKVCTIEIGLSYQSNYILIIEHAHCYENGKLTRKAASFTKLMVVVKPLFFRIRSLANCHRVEKLISSTLARKAAYPIR